MCCAYPSGPPVFTLNFNWNIIVQTANPFFILYPRVSVILWSCFPQSLFVPQFVFVLSHICSMFWSCLPFAIINCTLVCVVSCFYCVLVLFALCLYCFFFVQSLIFMVFWSCLPFVFIVCTLVILSLVLLLCSGLVCPLSLWFVPQFVLRLIFIVFWSCLSFVFMVCTIVCVVSHIYCVLVLFALCLYFFLVCVVSRFYCVLVLSALCLYHL